MGTYSAHALQGQMCSPLVKVGMVGDPHRGGKAVVAGSRRWSLCPSDHGYGCGRRHRVLHCGMAAMAGRISGNNCSLTRRGPFRERHLSVSQRPLSDDGERAVCGKKIDVSRTGKRSLKRGCRRQSPSLSSVGQLDCDRALEGECSASKGDVAIFGKLGTERKVDWFFEDVGKGRAVIARRRKRGDWLVRRDGGAVHCVNAVDEIAATQDVRTVKRDMISSGERKYMFHVQGGGLVRAAVDRHEDRCTIAIEIDDSEMLSLDRDADLFMNWGLFRADCDAWVVLDEADSPPGTVPVAGEDGGTESGWEEAEAMRTPFTKDPSGRLQLLMDLDARAAPFSVKFALFQPYKGTWFRSTKGTDFTVPVGIRPGKPYPLGVSWRKDGSANFSIYSRHAEHVTLCLYDDVSSEPQIELDLDRLLHRTGDVWHVQVDSVTGFSRYGYKCKGELTWESGNRFVEECPLLDPYAHHVSPLIQETDELGPSPRMLGLLVPDEPSFDWDVDVPPRHRLEELLVYRLSIPGFTAEESTSVPEELRGTFVGVLDKVDHFKELGVNAVMLAPITVHDDKQGPYFPINFFALMPCYGVDGDVFSASAGLKTLIRELHVNGMEVLLEVSYCHTAEGSDEEPINLSMRGIDNATYYITDSFGHLVRTGSSGNSLNCNYPPVQSLVLDSLRHWVMEYHIDGFCFANAGALLLGPNGEHLSRPPLVEAIAFDPILSDVKLIADLTFSETLRFPNWGRWAEFSGCFNNDVTKFLGGSAEHLSSFATRFCGSADVFQGVRGPAYGLNFISSLPDVEDQADEATELDFPSADLQRQQMLNCFTALFLSQGIPVLTMGQEYGCFSAGMLAANSEHGGFDWRLLESESGQQIKQFISNLITIRKRRSSIFQEGGESNPEKRPAEDGDIYLAFNAHNHSVDVTLPEPPEGSEWFQLVKTSAKSKPVVVTAEETISDEQFTANTIRMDPYSSLVLEARSARNEQSTTLE
ncbi:hypothetical protein CBR_g22242 [Chara braunii]|uniref:Glycosyl hydrolase family 13 catalytic domain-containing protein n=1 Tax=Chara braunii TaxID=69332 RepID=A0A388L2R7_CHABU|nr:hypothetical protein CBR_g22242 [Chara braunii]GBG76494.1 hypothetical protein CBR_g22242 [Chara braunii]|eukprot:GBG76493.1 hypothetical protein CBR_g22242 [Chara braunii]